MKGLDLISSALRLIGVLASGEQPSGAESDDALLIAQQMVDSWQAERLNIFTVTISEFSLVPGQQTYTYGTGGNFNAARPAKIEQASIVSLLNPAQPLELPLQMVNEDGWQAIPVKVITSTLPTVLYDDGGYPLRSLNFWCIPSIVSKVRIYGWQALNTFPDLTTDVTFPPSYVKALRYNLAVDLAPEFGKELPPAVAAQAISSKAVLKNMNAPLVESRCDPAVSGSRKQIYNWITDQPAGRY